MDGGKQNGGLDVDGVEEKMIGEKRVVKKGKFKLWIARDSQDNSIKKEIFRKETR